MEAARIAFPTDPRVHWFSYVVLADDKIDFPLEVTPKSVRPSVGLAIPIGANIKIRFAWNTAYRGDAPSGQSAMRSRVAGLA